MFLAMSCLLAGMKTSIDSGPQEREAFSRRLVILETPITAERLEQAARATGRSVGATVRHAVRYFLAAAEAEGR